MLKKLFVLILICLSFSSYALTPKSTDNQLKQGVTQALNKSVDCWNSADLGCFMDAYVKDKDTLYISGNKISHGWQQFYDNYQKRFGTDKVGMGHLEIKIIDIKPLGNNYAFLYGRWTITLPNEESSGVTSMVFVKTGSKWQIMSTHSNS